MRETADAIAELSERRDTLAGPWRPSAPVTFGTLHLGPALYPFLAANPGVELTLELDDRFVDAAAEGYDAVIRHGAVRDSVLVVKRHAWSRRVLVASPAHLATNGAPRSLAELEAHKAILYVNRVADWRFTQGTTATVVRPRRTLRINHGLMKRDAAVAGLGIALLPTFIVYADLAHGALQALDSGAEADAAEVHLVYRKDGSASAKVRALAECLRRAFGDPPYWDR